MFKTEFENLRRTCPLIHNITNYVTVNDCANMVLACGASPIMADDAAEVEDITTICGGLNINIGTLNHDSVESMKLALKKEIGQNAALECDAGKFSWRRYTVNQFDKKAFEADHPDLADQYSKMAVRDGGIVFKPRKE